MDFNAWYIWRVTLGTICFGNRKKAAYKKRRKTLIPLECKSSPVTSILSPRVMSGAEQQK